MDTLLDTNPLLSWNMFQEKSGRIMLKVRFGQNEGEEEPNTNVHFRRKSESQIKRDNRRAYQYNTRIVKLLLKVSLLQNLLNLLEKLDTVE